MDYNNIEIQGKKNIDFQQKKYSVLTVEKDKELGIAVASISKGNSNSIIGILQDVKQKFIYSKTKWSLNLDVRHLGTSYAIAGIKKIKIGQKLISNNHGEVIPAFNNSSIAIALEESEEKGDIITVLLTL